MKAKINPIAMCMYPNLSLITTIRVVIIMVMISNLLLINSVRLNTKVNLTWSSVTMFTDTPRRFQSVFNGLYMARFPTLIYMMGFAISRQTLSDTHPEKYNHQKILRTNMATWTFCLPATIFIIICDQSANNTLHKFQIKPNNRFTGDSNDCLLNFRVIGVPILQKKHSLAETKTFHSTGPLNFPMAVE
uniref:Uncharacterized protein n=1 Tax=Glossina brevipalpis TaxID=37001 RepID=A0A1A9WAX0_9MUSC